MWYIAPMGTQVPTIQVPTMHQARQLLKGGEGERMLKSVVPTSIASLKPKERYTFEVQIAPSQTTSVIGFLPLRLVLATSDGSTPRLRIRDVRRKGDAPQDNDWSFDDFTVTAIDKLLLSNFSPLKNDEWIEIDIENLGELDSSRINATFVGWSRLKPISEPA